MDMIPQTPSSTCLQDARRHIRAALRELDSLETTLAAYASDDEFGQPNRATAATDALLLALDAMEALERAECSLEGER